MQHKLLALLFCLFPLSLYGQLAAAPVFTPGGGTYTSPQTVTASSPTSGALLFCTTNGIAPSMVSQQYANNSTFTVATSQTLQCIAAFPLVNRQNVQNDSPTAPGTYWKIADCATATAWLNTTSYAVGALASFSGKNYIALSANTNKQPNTNPSIWANATTGDCAADNPGGTGVPSAQAHTIGNVTPSLSGGSMKFTETVRTGKQTNILYPVNGSFDGSGTANAATYFLSDFYLQPGSDGGNISSFETDQFQFNTSGTNIRYMYGMQYCVIGGGCPGGVTGLDIVGNSNVPWTYTGISSPKPTVGQWLHYQVLTHRVPAEETTKPCTATGTWPYLYWDHIVLNGIDNHTGNNGTLGWKYCANANPFSAVTGFQFQIDISSKTSVVSGSFFVDNANFLATTDPSGATSATYVISAATPTRVINFGARVSSGSQVQF